jgi:hypothetical protein
MRGRLDSHGIPPLDRPVVGASDVSDGVKTPSVGRVVRNGLHCGREWVIVGAACGTRVAGLLPPSHPGLEFGQANENP